MDNFKLKKRKREMRETKDFIMLCQTGWYWIDPNLGMPDDAISVICNITNMGETCIFPDIHSSHMPSIPWRKENNKTDWYSHLRGGFRVRSMKFLFFSI